MRRSKAGDRGAFTQLYEEYFGQIVCYFRNRGLRDCVDLTQEVFVRAWEHRSSYRGEAQVRGYLFGIARRVMFESFRRRLRARRDRNETRFESHPHEPSEIAEKKEEQELVHAAVLRLPPKQRQAVESVLTRRESLEVGCSAEAARRRLCDAKRSLATILRGMRPE